MRSHSCRCEIGYQVVGGLPVCLFRETGSSNQSNLECDMHSLRRRGASNTVSAPAAAATSRRRRQQQRARASTARHRI